MMRYLVGYVVVSWLWVVLLAVVNSRDDEDTPIVGIMAASIAWPLIPFLWGWGVVQGIKQARSPRGNSDNR